MIIASPTSGVPHHHLITLGPLLNNGPGKHRDWVGKYSLDSHQYPLPLTTGRVAKGLCRAGFLRVFLGQLDQYFHIASSPSILLGLDLTVRNLLAKSLHFYITSSPFVCA